MNDHKTEQRKAPRLLAITALCQQQDDLFLLTYLLLLFLSARLCSVLFHGVDINYIPSPLFSHLFAGFIQFCGIYELEKYNLEGSRLMWLLGYARLHLMWIAYSYGDLLTCKI